MKMKHIHFHTLLILTATESGGYQPDTTKTQMARADVNFFLLFEIKNF